MLSEDEVRELFWNTWNQAPKRVGALIRHNMQNADTRTAFADLIDQLERSGQISEEVAFNVTLDD